MNDYDYHVPTDIRFGRDKINCLAEEIGKYGKKVLLVYGGGSIKKNGIYSKVYEVLEKYEIYELPGIEPNPKLSSVRKGAEMCKKYGIEAVLAVGGGSMHQSILHVQHFMTGIHGIWYWTDQKLPEHSRSLRYSPYPLQVRR